jgi:hypothetical protein
LGLIRVILYRATETDWHQDGRKVCNPVKTGDGQPEDSGLTRNEENVIRLPRDWLGPPEELVPIGPAARARAAQRELGGDMPPTADAFWSEDSAALHDAVQAPPATSGAYLDPPVGLVPPLAGRRIPTLPRLPRPSFGGVAARVSWRWSAVTVAIVALIVVAAIGTSQESASRPGAAHRLASHAAATVHHGVAPRTDTANRLASTARANTGAGALRRVTKRSTPRHHETARVHARTRAGTGTRGARPAKARHSATAHRSTGSPAPTVTEAAPPPSRAGSSEPVSSESTPTGEAATTGSSVSSGSGSSASTSGSTGSSHAPGSAGPTRLGSTSGGCNPKCS